MKALINQSINHGSIRPCFCSYQTVSLIDHSKWHHVNRKLSRPIATHTSKPKTYIGKASKGFSFLGYHFGPKATVFVRPKKVSKSLTRVLLVLQQQTLVLAIQEAGISQQLETLSKQHTYKKGNCMIKKMYAFAALVGLALPFGCSTQGTGNAEGALYTPPPSYAICTCGGNQGTWVCCGQAFGGGTTAVLGTDCNDNAAGYYGYANYYSACEGEQGCGPNC